jgi:integrase
VGRTFERLGDLDDTCHAGQEWNSTSRAVKQAGTRASAHLPSDRPGDIQGAHQRAKLALVFPGERGTPFSGWSKAKSALDTVSGVSGWWLHDLRRTLATGLQRLGVRLEVTEAVLNHLSGSRAGVVGIYQRHDWAEEKRAALDA